MQAARAGTGADAFVHHGSPRNAHGTAPPDGDVNEMVTQLQQTGGVRAGRRAPSWIAMAAIAVAWLNPLTGGPSAAVQPWLVSALCACILAGCVGVQMHWRLAAVLAMFAAWAFLLSGLTLETLALAGGLLVVYLSAAAAGCDVRVARAVRLAWLAAALISTVMALSQYFGMADGLRWVSASSSHEAYANLRQRNQFATLTVLGIAALATAPALQPAKWMHAAAVLLGTGLAATTSRTGVLELALLCAMAAAWRGPERNASLRLVATAAVSYAVAAVTLPAVQAHFLGIEATTLWGRVAGVAQCSSRTVLWTNVLHLIGLKPWLGWGWGELDYAHYATLYPGARFCDILDNAHNLPLHIAVELGVPAAVIAMVLAIICVIRLRPLAESDPERRLGWSVLAAIMVHTMVEYPLWYGPFQMAAGLAIGLLLPSGASRSVRAGVLAAALFGCALAYAGWDYYRVGQVYMQPEDRAAQYRDSTLEHARRSWLFREQAEFAALTVSELRPDTARWTLDSAESLLHFSPEPKVIELAIESATMLNLRQKAAWHIQRFKAAFPDAYREWSEGLRKGLRADGELG